MMKYALLLCSIVTAMNAAVIGQVDTFEDGTTMGWFVPGPHPVPPTNVASGGPDGDDDSYLQLTATGAPGGPGSRLAVLSGPQWGGDYLGAGITHIAMDVRNFGPSDLHLRLLFEAFPDEPFMPPTDLALSADAIIVPANSDWMRIVFAVTPDALATAGFGTVEGALMGADTIRIFHNPLPTFSGPGVGPPMVNAVLGVDNITAVVPEPSTWLFGVTGLAVLVAGRMRSSRGSKGTKDSH